MKHPRLPWDNEAILQEQTRQLLVLLHRQGRVLEFYHPYDSRKSRGGWPDWCVVLNRVRECDNAECSGYEVIWIELKTSTGKLTAEQGRWKTALAPRAFVVRSVDEFVNVLRRYGVKVGIA